MKNIKLVVLLQLNDIKDFNISEKGFATEVLNIISTNPKELTGKAFQKKPKLKIAKLTWENRKNQVQITLGNYLPQISFQYRFNRVLSN
ncbi:MAG: TolC family protein [Flavobacteriales bacterium]